MKSTITFSLFTILVTACAPQAEQLPAPKTNETALQLALDTSIPICTLDLSNVQLGNDLKNKLDDLQQQEHSNFGKPLSQQYRLHALRRLQSAFNAGGDPQTLAASAKKYYDEFKAPPLGDSFETAMPAYEHADNLLIAQQQRTDLESADFNIRFCVINDLSGPIRGTIRKRFNEKISSGSNGFNFHADSPLTKFIKIDAFANAAAEDLMNTAWAGAQTNDEDMVALGLMRTRATAILPSEPRTADAFWTARDREMIAIQTYILEHDYKSVAAQLADMTTYEQTTRHLFRDPALNIKHFGTKEEANKFAKEIAAHMGTADEFNTAILQTLLETRVWLNDEVDGAGASYDAWLIAQHADRDRPFQKDVLSRMEKVLDKGWVSKSNYAYLYDRVASADKKPQRYGTQGRCVATGKWEPNELEAPEKIDERRASVGLGTLGDYKAHFKTVCFMDEE